MNAFAMKPAMGLDRVAGLLLVLALHAAGLWALWGHRLLPAANEAQTLFVNFIAPPAPPKDEPAPRREPPKQRIEEAPRPRQLVAEAPLVAANDPLAVPPAPTPAPTISAPPEPRPAAGPVTLANELSVSCPERSAPVYPMPSRRLNETGTTVLRVELDEQGRVVATSVATGSGSSRLDDAALAAIKNWRCTPAQRNGQAVRAVALQPFKFVLQGN